MHRYITLTAICIRGTVDELETYAHSVSQGYRPPISKKWPEDLRTLISVGTYARLMIVAPSLEVLRPLGTRMRAVGSLIVLAAVPTHHPKALCRFDCMQAIVECWRPHIQPSSCPLQHALQDCWAQDPAARQSMQEVVPRLIAIKEKDVLSTLSGDGPACCTIC